MTWLHFSGRISSNRMDTSGADSMKIPQTLIATMATAPVDVKEAACAKYEALEQLFSTTEQDFLALRAEFDAVQGRLAKIRTENEYLIDQLSQYAPSDFESDQSDLEKDADLLDKCLPLPHVDKNLGASSRKNQGADGSTCNGKKRAAPAKTSS